MPKKININATDEQRDEYTANILYAWSEASLDQLERGRAWYTTANQLATLMADGYTRMGAGVIAALSPQVQWERNVRLAQDAFSGNEHGQTRANLKKVYSIMVGEDPEEVLPYDRKTGHFFRCIADPSDPWSVVIDRHAHDIAVGELYGEADRGLDAQGRYNLIANCYREAAAILGELPSTVQAVTWVAHTERNTH
jgi:hypothetical protein